MTTNWKKHTDKSAERELILNTSAPCQSPWDWPLPSCNLPDTENLQSPQVKCPRLQECSPCHTEPYSDFVLSCHFSDWAQSPPMGPKSSPCWSSPEIAPAASRHWNSPNTHCTQLHHNSRNTLLRCTLSISNHFTSPQQNQQMLCVPHIPNCAYLSKKCASALDVEWFSTNIISSQSRTRLIYGPSRNACGSSCVKNSSIRSRLQDSSNIIVHFLCCKSDTCSQKIPFDFNQLQLRKAMATSSVAP